MKSKLSAISHGLIYPIIHTFFISASKELALCTAALLPELKPAPCFLSAIIGRT